MDDDDDGDLDGGCDCAFDKDGVAFDFDLDPFADLDDDDDVDAVDDNDADVESGGDGDNGGDAALALFVADFRGFACVGSLITLFAVLSGPLSAGCVGCRLLLPGSSTFSWAIVAGSTGILFFAGIGGTGSAVSMCL